MLSVKFVRHSVQMVWSNRANVARIAGPLIVATLALQLVLYFGFGVNVMAGDEMDLSETPGGLVPLLLLYLLNGIAGLWVYVGWHRYVLLEEYPTGFWPSVPVDRVLAYVGISILIGLIVFALSSGAGLILGLISKVDSGGVLIALIIVIVAVAALVLTARLSVALPAAAIGRPIGIKGALHATKGGSATCAFGLFLTGLVALLVAIPAGILATVLPAPLNFFLALPFSIFVIFVGVSYLTTLYGYYVEKRELS